MARSGHQGPVKDEGLTIVATETWPYGLDLQFDVSSAVRSNGSRPHPAVKADADERDSGAFREGG